MAREIVAKLRMNDKKGISVPTDDPHFTNHYPVPTGLLRSQKSWSKFDGLFTLQIINLTWINCISCSLLLIFRAKVKCRVVSKTQVTQTAYGSMFSAIIMDETAVIGLVCWGTAICPMFYDNFKVIICTQNFHALI